MEPKEEDAKPDTSSNGTIYMGVDEMFQKLKSCCRLCMDEKRAKISLFTNTYGDITSADVVNIFTNVNVHDGDGLPNQVCTKCESMLSLIWDFKNECENSNATLSTIYQTLNQEIGKNEEGPIFQEAFEYDVDEGSMTVEALESDGEFEDELTEQSEANIQDMTSNSKPDLENLLRLEAIKVENAFDQPENEQIFISIIEEDTSHESTTPDLTTDSELKKKRVRNKNSKCDICGKCVEGPAKLQRHMRVHLREKQIITRAKPTPKSITAPAPVKILSCEVCKKEFTIVSKLKKHLQIHLPMSMRPKCHKCIECGKEYLDAASLRTHVSIAHSDNVIMYPCTICGKEFTRKNYRDYHMRLHTSDKPVKNFEKLMFFAGNFV